MSLQNNYKYGLDFRKEIVMLTDIQKICVKVDLDQLQYQVNTLKEKFSEENSQARIMRIGIAKKYLNLLEQAIIKGA